MLRRTFLSLAVVLASACEPVISPPQSGAVSPPPSPASAAPSVAFASPVAVTSPSPVPTATPSPKPTPTPPKVPAPSVEGYVYFDRTADDVLPSNMPKLVNVDVVALSKTIDKPYYRHVTASPRFEFTDLPYEAEIEITSAAERWTRGIVTIKTGVQPIRMSVSIPMKSKIYVNVPVQ